MLRKWVVLFLIVSLLTLGTNKAAAFVLSPGQVAVQASGGEAGFFVENVGQWGTEPRFRSQWNGYTLWLADDHIWVSAMENDPDAPSRQQINLRLTFPGSNPTAKLEPFGPSSTQVSYFLGNDPAHWQTHVPAWAGVRYVDFYPGIDMEVTADGWALVCTTTCENLNDVRLWIEGADTLDIHPEKAQLELGTAAGSLALPMLRVQGVAEASSPTRIVHLQGIEVSAPYTLNSSIAAHPADASAPTPESYPPLVLSTYLGGSSFEYENDIAVDAAKNIYVVGYTSSNDFPVTPGAVDVARNGADIYVAKLNPTATAILFATYLGGSKEEYVSWVTTDNTGAVYITAQTDSTDFPTTPGAFDTTPNGGKDVFLTKINPAGTALVFSTYIGSSGSEYSADIAVDSSLAVYLMGRTTSASFPITAGAWDSAFGGDGECFALKMNPSGTALTYATFIGGSGDEYCSELAVDSSGNVFLVGRTYSADFPVIPGSYDLSLNGESNGFVVKLNSAGSSGFYATYFGSHLGGGIGAIAIDAAGAAYIAGSGNPVTTPITGTMRGYSQIFVSKLHPDGSKVLYRSTIGGSNLETVSSIVVNAQGEAYITGRAYSGDFPVTPNAYDPVCGVKEECTSNDMGILSEDAFLAGLNASGTEWIYSTYLGGWRSEEGEGLAIDADGDIYLVGETFSNDIATTPGVIGPTKPDILSEDAFIMKFDFSLLSQIPPPPIQIAGQTGGYLSSIVVRDNIAYVGIGHQLAAVDVSQSYQATLRSLSLPFDSMVADLVLSGNYAYVAARSAGLQVVDISNPDHLRQVFSIDTPGYPSGVDVSGAYLFVADNMLRVYDLHDPGEPVEVGAWSSGGGMRGVEVAGQYAYIADGSQGLKIVNITDPSAPVLAGALDTPGDAMRVSVSGTIAYVSDGSGLRVLDVSNPASPIEISSVSGSVVDAMVMGDYIYLACDTSGIKIMDIQNPASPALVATYDTPGHARQVFVSDGRAYVADGDQSVSVIDITTPGSPTRMFEYTYLGYAVNLIVQHNYAYVVDLYQGLRVMDITNPNRPVELRGRADLFKRPWDMALAEKADNGVIYGYFADSAAGIVIYNMNVQQAVRAVPAFNNLGFIVGIDVQGDYLYLANGYGGLRVYDISTPTDPVLRGSWPKIDYSADVDVVGKYAYVADHGSGLHIIDVSNPISPTWVGGYDTPGYAYGIKVVGNLALVADRDYGVRIIDVSNPAHPQEIGYYDTPGLAYDVDVLGQYAYVADLEGGLSVINIADPAHPVLFASLDTDGATRNVACRTGNVFLADEAGGLIILGEKPAILDPYEIFLPLLRR